MRTRFTAIAAVSAALLMGVVGVASASAQVFKASKTGALTSEGGTQTFKTHGMTVRCKKVKDSGTVTSTETSEQAVVADYEECEIGATPVTISAADYTFHAAGTVDVTKEITIEATGSPALCTIKVPAQSGLSTVTYKNVSGKIEVVAVVTNITSSGKGTLEEEGKKLCEYTQAEETKGEYKGDSVSTLTGGTLEWVS